jgi:hypothetical protein
MLFHVRRSFARGDGVAGAILLRARLTRLGD